MKAKTSFIVTNLLKGFAYMGLIVLAFILAKRYIPMDYITWLEPVYNRPTVMFLIFLTSEIIVGIIPPEFFMVWALRSGDVNEYIWTVVLLAIISYFSGLIGYAIGRYFNTTRIYRYYKIKYFGKWSKYLYEFGGLLVAVAATTPLPWSGVSMMVGSERYPFKRYLAFSLLRFLRFAVYGFIIWEANII